MAIFFWPVHWTGPIATALVVFVGTTIFIDYTRAVRQRRAQLGEPLLRAGIKTVRGNRRHYGGMVVHVGILIMALGFVGSGLFRSEISVVMAPGDVVKVGGERIRFEGVSTYNRANYQTLEGQFTLLNSGREMTPERRKYIAQPQTTTEAGIDSTLLRDAYVVLADATGDKWAVHVYINPLVSFVWIGSITLLLGLLLTLSNPRRSRHRSGTAATSKEAKGQ